MCIESIACIEYDIYFTYKYNNTCKSYLCTRDVLT